MSIVVTANEAALRLVELLDEVEGHGETILITRNGKEVAQLAAPPAKPQTTLRGLVASLLAVRTGDPTFADDLERIRAEQPPMPEDPWAS